MRAKSYGFKYTRVDAIGLMFVAGFMGFLVYSGLRPEAGILGFSVVGLMMGFKGWAIYY